MKTLDIVHPAAKTLVDIAKSQDAEVIIRPSSKNTCSKILWLVGRKNI